MAQESVQENEAVDEASFENAERTFQFQEYEKAAKELQNLLYPNLLLEDLTQIRTARELLGASLWFLGDLDGAKQEWTSLLIGWPEHELDPFYYPPDMIALFEELREELIQLEVITRASKDGEGVTGEATFYERQRI